MLGGYLILLITVGSRFTKKISKLENLRFWLFEKHQNQRTASSDPKPIYSVFVVRSHGYQP